MRRVVGRAGLGGLGVLGVVVAISAAVVSRMGVRWLDVTWPLGLVLVLAATTAFFHAAYGLAGRAGAIAAVAGWVAGMAACLWPRAGGDVVIAADWLGLLLVFGGLVAAITTLLRP